MFDNVIQILKPEPDSHFRLRSCPVCHGDNVAYVQKKANNCDLWHGKCFDCEYEGRGAMDRHEAQENWNWEGRERNEYIA